MLANHCRKNNYKVQILDCEVMGFNFKKSAEEINSLNPKIACFVVYGQQPSASTQNMEGATSTSKILKQINPKIKTLFVVFDRLREIF